MYLIFIDISCVLKSGYARPFLVSLCPPEIPHFISFVYSCWFFQVVGEQRSEQDDCLQPGDCFLVHPNVTSDNGSDQPDFVLYTSIE